MDALDVLNIIAGFSTRTAQAERAHKKLAKDLTETRQTLKNAISELEEATRLATVLYKIDQRMGAVIDFLLEKHRSQKSNDGLGSLEVILRDVMEQIQSEDSPNKMADHAFSATAELG